MEHAYIYTVCRFRTQLADGLFWPQLERWQASRLGDTVFARPFAREAAVPGDEPRSDEGLASALPATTAQSEINFYSYLC